MTKCSRLIWVIIQGYRGLHTGSLRILSIQKTHDPDQYWTNLLDLWCKASHSNRSNLNRPLFIFHCIFYASMCGYISFNTRPYDEMWMTTQVKLFISLFHIGIRFLLSQPRPVVKLQNTSHASTHYCSDWCRNGEPHLKFRSKKHNIFWIF